jgi:hypothetical protein
MRVVALLRGVGVEGGGLDRALDRLAAAVDDAHAGERDLGDVAFLKVAEAARQRDQRVHVGAEIVLALAVADHQRRTQARTGEHARLAGGDGDDRVGAVQARDHLLHRFEDLRAALLLAFEHVRDDFRVGLRLEHEAVAQQFLAQLAWFSMMPLCTTLTWPEGMRMRVELARHAMRGPTRVRDAGHAVQAGLLLQRVEVLHLALGAQPLDPVGREHGDAGGVVPAVFQCLQALDEVPDDGPLGADADDSAHGWLLPFGGAASLAPRPRGPCPPARPDTRADARTPAMASLKDCLFNELSVGTLPALPGQSPTSVHP